MTTKKLLKALYRKLHGMRRSNIMTWSDDNRLCVAMQCTDHYSKEKWLANIERTYPEIEKQWQVRYYYNTLEKESLASGMDVIFTFSVNDTFLELAEKLKWAFISQSGTEFLEGKQYNFDIITAAGFASRAVAEYSLCTTLLLLRKINRTVINQSAKKWAQKSVIEQGSGLLSTKTVGVLGLGHNGCAVADIFKKIGCCVLGYDKRRIKAKSIDRMFYPDQLGEMMTRADIVVICLPHNAETERLIGAEELRMLGTNGLLINVARAAIVRENDLVDALKGNTIAGVALDVFETEPLPRNSRLWGFPNAVITPHIAGNVNYFVDEIQRAFLSRLRRHAKTH